jgi:hypothetical protein
MDPVMPAKSSAIQPVFPKRETALKTPLQGERPNPIREGKTLHNTNATRCDPQSISRLAVREPERFSRPKIMATTAGCKGKHHYKLNRLKYRKGWNQGKRR